MKSRHKFGIDAHNNESAGRKVQLSVKPEQGSIGSIGLQPVRNTIGSTDSLPLAKLCFKISLLKTGPPSQHNSTRLTSWVQSDWALWSALKAGSWSALHWKNIQACRQCVGLYESAHALPLSDDISIHVSGRGGNKMQRHDATGLVTIDPGMNETTAAMTYGAMVT